MPSMGHEATAVPEVKEIEPGLYEVSGVVFSMSGTWEVRYRAARSSIQDEAAFRYQVR
jgi:YtkA-like